MYDKKKTLSSYMGGGYMNPMGYAKGGYRKGLSSVLYRAGLNRDKQIAQEEFEEQAKKLEKEQYWRGVGKTLGKVGGTALGALLAAPTGGLSIAAGRALGATLGTAAGGAIGGSGQDASNIKDSSTGLYKDDFEYLRDQGRKAEDFKRLGKESAIAGVGEYASFKFDEYADAKFADKLARDYGIGGDKFAEDVTKKGLLDNPYLAEEGLDLADMQEIKYGEKEIFTLPNSKKALYDTSLNPKSITDQGYKELKDREALQLSPEGREKYAAIFKNQPPMSYEKSLTNSNLLGALAKEAVSKQELSEPLSGQTLNLIRELSTGGVNKVTEAEDLIKNIEKVLLNNSSDFDKIIAENMNQGGLMKGYQNGGMYNGYKSGGLINMKQFGRRIL